MILQTILQVILEVLMHEAAGRLVAHHGAAAVRITNPMPSHATAWSSARRDHHGAGRDNDDVAAVRAASAIGAAMETRSASARDLDHVRLRCERGQRHGGSCARAYQGAGQEGYRDQSVHARLPLRWVKFLAAGTTGRRSRRIGKPARA